LLNIKQKSKFYILTYWLNRHVQSGTSTIIYNRSNKHLTSLIKARVQWLQRTDGQQRVSLNPNHIHLWLYRYKQNISIHENNIAKNTFLNGGEQSWHCLFVSRIELKETNAVLNNYVDINQFYGENLILLFVVR